MAQNTGGGGVDTHCAKNVILFEKPKTLQIFPRKIYGFESKNRSRPKIAIGVTQRQPAFKLIT